MRRASRSVRDFLRNMSVERILFVVEDVVVGMLMMDLRPISNIPWNESMNGWNMSVINRILIDEEEFTELEFIVPLSSPKLITNRNIPP